MNAGARRHCVPPVAGRRSPVAGRRSPVVFFSLALWALFTLAGCGGAAAGLAISASASDNDAAALGRALAAAQVPAAASRPMAFVVAAGPPVELVAVDLAQGAKVWSVAA